MGLSYATVDDLTYSEYIQHVLAYNEAQQEKNINELNLHITGAYYTQIFKNTKKLSPLKTYLIKHEEKIIKKPKKKYEDDEKLLQKIQTLNVMFGGKQNIQ